MELKDAISLILGTVGTVLGLVNLARSVRDERVRLRVVPCLAWNTGSGWFTARSAERIEELLQAFGAPTMAIEVLNLSKFPVTIDEVGLQEKDAGPKDKRAPFMMGADASGKSCPIKLSSRESVTFFSKNNHCLGYDFSSKTVAYATTSCDVVKFGTAHALSAWIEFFQKHIRSATSDEAPA